MGWLGKLFGHGKAMPTLQAKPTLLGMTDQQMRSVDKSIASIEHQIQLHIDILNLDAVSSNPKFPRLRLKRRPGSSEAVTEADARLQKRKILYEKLRVDWSLKLGALVEPMASPYLDLFVEVRTTAHEYDYSQTFRFQLSSNAYAAILSDALQYRISRLTEAKQSTLSRKLGVSGSWLYVDSTLLKAAVLFTDADRSPDFYFYVMGATLDHIQLDEDS